MNIDVTRVGSIQQVVITPYGNEDKTFLHSLVTQLPNLRNHTRRDSVYVSQAEYGVSGIYKVVLTNKAPIAEW